MEELVGRHRRACDGFARVAGRVPADRWSDPTPCTEWDARAVVEHVIGFHDFLLLRPIGVLIGPAVAIAKDAPLPDRLVARYGRDPHWRA